MLQQTDNRGSTPRKDPNDDLMLVFVFVLSRTAQMPRDPCNTYAQRSLLNKEGQRGSSIDSAI